MAERFEARRPFYWTGFDGVRVVLGAILLTAAALKAHQLVTDPLLATAGSWDRWFSIGVVQFELFLGLWLLSGLYPRAVWGVSLAVFALFCVVAFAKLVSGAENCGCLGQVAVPPWVMLVVDLGAVALLLRFKPLAPPPPQENRPDFGLHGRGRRRLPCSLSCLASPRRSFWPRIVQADLSATDFGWSRTG